MHARQLITVLFCVCSIASSAQPDTGKVFPLGKTETIYSTQLGERRTLNIYLPDGYNSDTARYPVIYLLDGSADEDFVHVVGIVQFLTMIEAMPKSIVVGIANVDRRRDFTFPTTIEKDKKAFPTTGGSAKFINFLEKDLEPYVKRTLKCNGTATIIGQSLGGLLATEALLRKPWLFSNYIIVSPSLWWDNESLLRQANELLSRHPLPKMTIYIAVGTEGAQMEGDARQLSDLLATQPNVKIELAPMPTETHLTILHNAAYNALERLNVK